MQTMDRSKIIGGSDIAAILAMSPWKTPLYLWAEKTGRLANKVNEFEAAEIGAELEEYVARKFQKKTGIKLRRDNRTFTHPEYPYMVAHIDRWVCGEDALFEAKTCSAWLEKKWKGEEIPEEYVLQVMWYLGIVGKTKGYIAVLIGGQKFLWKEIVFDADLFEKLVSAAKNFMEEFILKEKAPMAIDGDSETLAEMYPDPKEIGLVFEGQDAEALNHLIEERAAGVQVIKDAQEEMRAIEARIKQFLGEAEAGETDMYRVTWKKITKKEYTVKAQSYRMLKTTPKKIQQEAA